MLRICRKLNIKSTVKYSNNGCTRQAANPQYIAENILNREFTAKAPNEKWLTDVTEFHYYIGIEKHKVYLSAILDLYDRLNAIFLQHFTGHVQQTIAGCFFSSKRAAVGKAFSGQHTFIQTADSLVLSI